MVKSESLMPNIPRQPPHIGPSFRINSNPICSKQIGPRFRPTRLIQLFLKFCRYSCGGDRYRIDIGSGGFGIYWDEANRNSSVSLSSHFQSDWTHILVIITTKLKLSTGKIFPKKKELTVLLLYYVKWLRIWDGSKVVGPKCDIHRYLSGSRLLDTSGHVKVNQPLIKIATILITLIVIMITVTWKYFFLFQ